MIRKLIIFSISVIVILSPGSSYARKDSSKGNHMVRVCVAKDKDTVDVRIKGRYTIETLYTGEVLERSKRSLSTTKVIPTNSGIKIGRKDFPVFGIRIVPVIKGEIYINKRRFRGIVDIVRTEGIKLLVINHVDIEDYLYGVLYYEMPHYWPTEALMAQAIAARTFALYRREEMKDKDYDLTNDSFSQVYGGKAGERWTSKRAVNLTKGKVLKYKGKILPAYYHSSCGGYTENASQLWNIKSPVLEGRRCPYCKNARHSKWKAMFSYKQMEERLRKYGIKCKDITYIVEGPRDKSGRLETVRIKDSGGVKNIPADKFRLSLGGTLIRSTNFTIEITRKGIIFRGKGWGHGVGMCQWGAYGMARKRHKHKKILGFYYPGAKIQRL